MKIFRYLIFFLILTQCFFSNLHDNLIKKGFRKWRISFKIAVFIATSAASLISDNTKKMEAPRNNNQVYQKKLFID